MIFSKRRSIIFGSYTTYYVATTGNNSNDGLTTATAWATLTYAVGATSPVIPGDKIYVKAGNYGNENIVFAKSGIKGAEIEIIGYKTTPGDRPPVLVTTASNPYAAYTNTDMPTYNGTTRNSGVWLDLNTQKYIKLSNLQAATYSKGVECGQVGTTTAVNNTVSGFTLYNVNVMTLGDSAGAYSGLGLCFGVMGTKFSNGNKMSYCLVVNAGAEGITWNGDYNKTNYCKVYCNETSGNLSTDYYFFICGNYNVTDNCYIERDSSISGGHHGYTVKTNAEQVIDDLDALPTINCVGNHFYNCSATNTPESFCVRHRGAQYNYFYKCYAIGTHTGTGGGGLGEGIKIRDGASNNTFEAIKVKNCNSGIIFWDSVEDGGAASPVSSGNKVINSVFINTYIGIDHRIGTGGVASDSGANTIANCTFYKTRFHIDGTRHCVAMVYKNIIFYGGAADGNFRDGTNYTDIAPSQFSNCCFYSITGGFNGFVVGSTTSGITTDPLFVAAASDNFHLGASSPSRNVGATLDYVPSDFDEFERPSSSYSIGAFERA